jgi:hypothetical protein
LVLAIADKETVSYIMQISNPEIKMLWEFLKNLEGRTILTTDSTLKEYRVEKMVF